LALWLYEQKCSSLFCIVGLCSTIIVAAISLAWLVIRYARISFGRPLSPDNVTPISAKGLACYVENDQVLFWKLGRISDIRRLVSMVQNTQTSVIVLHGEDGAGKTSLLRAGLQPALKQLGVLSVYCDATGLNPVSAFSGAVLTELKRDVESDLELLATEQTRSVLIIDSFEQLDVESSEHAPLFTLLRALHDHVPPHLVQLVIGFRNNYRPAWLKIEQRIGIRAVHLSLDLIRDDVASDGIETILQESDVNVDRSIIRDYIRGVASTHGEVSPVDIGIGAHIFEKWARRRPQRRLRFLDYVAAGGVRGVLMAHVCERLGTEYVFDTDRSALIQCIAHDFVNQETNERKLTGTSAAELADITGLNVDLLNDMYLPGLAAQESRILEVLPGENPAKYRIARELFVDALRHLKEEIDKTVNRTHLFLLDQYAWWKRTKHRRDFLRGSLLSLARLYCEASTGTHNIEFRNYINKSLTEQKKYRWITSTAVILAAGISATLWFFASAYIQKTRLSSWLLPGELYERQEQLKKLRIQGYAVSELGWLSSVNLGNLEITDARLTSLKGISNALNVQDITLDLTGAPIVSLDEVTSLPQLTTLKLYLGHSKIQNLADLPQAAKLQTLTLYLGGSIVRSINELAQMNQLRNLELHLAGSAVRDLTELTKLSALRKLTLDLDASQLRIVGDLNKATNLQDLIVNIESPRGDRRPNGGEIPNLAGLEGLKNLHLKLVSPRPDLQNPASDIDQPPAADLGSLRLPQGLQELAIDLGGFPVEQLPDLTRLEHLRTLSLHLHNSRVNGLPDLTQFHELQNLDLAIDGPLTRTGGIAKLKTLMNLSLEIEGREGSTLPALNGLKGLRNLTLNIAQTDISAMHDLATLRGLRELELHLKWQQIAKLPSLSDLDELQSLTIFFVGVEAQELPPLSIHHELSNLTLNLNRTLLQRLPDLKQFQGVRKLYVDLAGSEIQSLDSVMHAGKLNDLSLNLQDTQALQHLPELGQLKELTNLTLILDGSQIQELPDLAALKGMKTSKINLRNSRITNLTQTHRLGALEEITLDQGYSSLKDLPASLKEITFLWLQ